MADSLPEAVEPYPEISSKAYEHPADRAATAALKAVPMLDTVVRKLVEFSYERALRQSYLGNSVKVSERQLPELWASYRGRAPDPRHAGRLRPVRQLVAVLERADDRLPEADDRDRAPTCSSSSVPASSATMLAHELGHILSDHVLYITALNILLAAGGGLPLGLGLPVRAVRAVLLEWMPRRRAELRPRGHARGARPADRLPGADGRSPAACPPTSSTSTLSWPRRWSTRTGTTPTTASGASSTRSTLTHSNAVRRVSEVMRWVQSGEYDRIVRGEYRRRGEETNVREEATDAMEFYAERFRAMFRELGENVTNLGTQIGDVSQQVADWLRNRGSQLAPPRRWRPVRRRRARVAVAQARASGCARRLPLPTHSRRRRPALYRRGRLRARALGGAAPASP